LPILANKSGGISSLSGGKKEKSMFKFPELVEMLKAGVHFGHQRSKRHPKMEPYIYTQRNQINLIDLEQTAIKLKEALDFVARITSQGGVILFVSSKKQAKKIVENAAKNCGMPYIISRWLGGTFTNFGNIVRLPKKLKDLEDKQAKGELDKYTKKEQLNFQREIIRLKEMVEGIKEMVRLPEAIYVVDIKKDKTAVAEATTKKVPIVALTDTNVDPTKVQYPIPANDDAIKSIEMITNLIAEAVNEGKSQRPVPGVNPSK
jgi:small subunit ribosomal protein S2